MADGFLAPTGRFYPKTENFHAQTARAILGPEGQTDEPIQELLRRGYILRGAVAGGAVLCGAVYCGECAAELFYAAAEGWKCGDPADAS